MQPPNSTFQPYPQSGEVLDGKYRIERLLGEGGMGAVAKATHLLRRAPVALKFMSGAILSFPGAIERFVNEGVAASQIDSDHVVKVFDVGRLPSGAPYLVMEFLDGRDLGELLAAEGPRLPVPRAVHFTLQMLRALQMAHNAGIVHRDMKPSNCFVIEKDGEADFVKLVDFGISKVRTGEGESSQSANLTRTNSALGTPLYMSPEQARSPRDVDHRSDLYSVGAILYEMLGGRTPYTSETGEYTEILFKIFTTDPPPLVSTSPDVPPALAEIVHHALERNRDARYGSAFEMAEALVPFADGRSATLIARFRGMRGRSLLPSAPPPSGLAPSALPVEAPRTAVLVGSSVPPAAPVTPAPNEAATRPPTVPTDIGVTRDTGPSPRARPSAAVAAAIAGAALVLIGGAGFLAVHAFASGHAIAPPAPTHENIESAAATHVPAPETTAAMPAPSTNLAPLPSASIVFPANPAKPPTPRPSASAEPLAAPGSKASPPVSAPPSAQSLPTQLGDLKLH